MTTAAAPIGEKNVHILECQSTQVLVTFASHRDDCCNSTGTVRYVNGELKIRNWGKDNCLPQFREQVIKENSIVPALIKTKRDIILGGGLYTYMEEFKMDDEHKRNIKEVKMPDDAKAFFDKVDIDEYMSCAAANLLKHSNIFTEMTRNAKGEIDMIKAHQCRHVRAGVQNKTGKIEKYFLSGAWALKYQKEITEADRRIFPVPAYIKDKEQSKFMLHTGDDLITDDYYFEPFWWGDLDWIQVANAIPIFHQANLKHGYTIRYHIKVPRGYFYKNPIQQGVDALKKAKDDEIVSQRAFMDKVNALLAGVENAGRSLFTEFDVNTQLMKEYPGITIDPIGGDLKDEALLKLYEKSNQANISAQGIHPTLANIETQGRLSSGSEIRNAFLMYLAIHTPSPRRILLKAINEVKRINKWDPDIHFGFRDIEVTKLDDNAAGAQSVAVTDSATSSN